VGKPFAAAPIQLRAISTDSGGTPTEKLLASVTTAVDGTWSASLVGNDNLLLRAVHTGRPAVTSPLVSLAVAPAVTLGLVPGSSPPGQGVVQLEGTVTPGKPKVVIFAQSTRGRSAKPVRKIVSVVRGKFRCKLRLPAGVYGVWAETLADPRNVAGRSPRLRVAA
jgi:hypothetical protein